MSSAAASSAVASSAATSSVAVSSSAAASSSAAVSSTGAVSSATGAASSVTSSAPSLASDSDCSAQPAAKTTVAITRSIAIIFNIFFINNTSKVLFLFTPSSYKILGFCYEIFMHDQPITLKLFDLVKK